MLNSDIFFWQDWPMARQRMFFRMLVLGWAALLAVAWISLYAKTNGSMDQAVRLERKYSQIAPMASEVQRLRAGKGALAGLAPMAAAQQIIRELKIEPKLASIRPTELGGGGEGVQMLIESLNLDELLNLVQQLGARGGLKFLSFTLSHRLDDPMMADVQLVLGR